MPKLKEGWTFLWNSPKFHWFKADGRSICGKWLLLGNPELKADTHESPDDCKACRRKLNLLKAHKERNNEAA